MTHIAGELAIRGVLREFIERVPMVMTNKAQGCSEARS